MVIGKNLRAFKISRYFLIVLAIPHELLMWARSSTWTFISVHNMYNGQYFGRWHRCVCPPGTGVHRHHPPGWDGMGAASLWHTDHRSVQSPRGDAGTHTAISTADGVSVTTCQAHEPQHGLLHTGNHGNTGNHSNHGNHDNKFKQSNTYIHSNKCCCCGYSSAG